MMTLLRGMRRMILVWLRFVLWWKAVWSDFKRPRLPSEAVEPV